MATLTATFNRLCQEVNCLNEENEKLRALSSATAPGEPRVTVEPSPTQRAVQHRQERLCIEIVSLQEELKLEQREKSLLEGQLRVQQETHTEETQIMEGECKLLGRVRYGWVTIVRCYPGTPPYPIISRHLPFVLIAHLCLCPGSHSLQSAHRNGATPAGEEAGETAGQTGGVVRPLGGLLTVT
uniref:Uncharacterized protein n=1 Tax=Xenopus tropicalis TaxID=8364 RepID=A0A1B8XSK5_XENTR